MADYLELDFCEAAGGEAPVSARTSRCGPIINAPIINALNDTALRMAARPALQAPA